MLEKGADNYIEAMINMARTGHEAIVRLMLDQVLGLICNSNDCCLFTHIGRKLLSYSSLANKYMLSVQP